MIELRYREVTSRDLLRCCDQLSFVVSPLNAKLMQRSCSELFQPFGVMTTLNSLFSLSQHITLLSSVCCDYTISHPDAEAISSNDNERNMFPIARTYYRTTTEQLFSSGCDTTQTPPLKSFYFCYVIIYSLAFCIFLLCA